MSEENVAVVREMNIAFNRHDRHWLDFYAADVEYVMPPEWPEERVYRGREGLERLQAALEAVFAATAWEIERVIDAGEDCVIALAHMRGSVAGNDLDQRTAAVAYLRDGQITRQLTFLSWEDALEAAEYDE
jgi:ketosteroid isomerase-like protein